MPGCKNAGWHSGHALFSPYQEMSLLIRGGIFSWYEFRASAFEKACLPSDSRGKSKLGIDRFFFNSMKLCSGCCTVFLKKLWLNFTDESSPAFPVFVSSIDLAVGDLSSRKITILLKINSSGRKEIHLPLAGVAGSLSLGGSNTKAGTAHFHW